MAVAAVAFKNIGIGAFRGRQVIFKAVFSNIKQFATMSELLDKVPDVEIDGHGRFKYILIKIQDKSSNKSKLIARGYARAQWHADILEEVEKKLQPLDGLKAECLGGGRIECDPDEKTIKVYGYSQGFGKADHQQTVTLLQKKYVDYSITSSDEGY